MKFVEHVSLSELIERLEKGTKIHICIAFLGECGNRKTRLTPGQAIHNSPVCLAVKELPNGLKSCYSCRNYVQKTVIQSQKAMSGFCTNGVYEYIRPVVYDDRVICVIYVGNILLPDPCQREKLEKMVNGDLLKTMESHSTPQDCVKVADVLESYITFLFDRYGIENNIFDPLLENVKNYIKENLEYGFSMDELADAFHYTPKYLGQIFKARTGKSIKEYCNHQKIKQAKHNLTETNLSIEAVALRAGFNSVTYFDRVFHKLTGLSPQTYRSTSSSHKSRKSN